MAVADAPLRSLGVLGDRMNPYINWAKVYRYKNISDKDIESWRAGWLLRLYEDYAGQIIKALTDNNSIRFNDMEKAQLFLGFIAAFPKKEENNKDENNIEKENGEN